MWKESYEAEIIVQRTNFNWLRNVPVLFQQINTEKNILQDRGHTKNGFTIHQLRTTDLEHIFVVSILGLNPTSNNLLKFSPCSPPTSTPTVLSRKAYKH